jgi:uncharacterized protein YndB with AHSA1/START domain
MMAIGPREQAQVSAARPIAAAAGTLFRVLADPANHPAIDGSGRLRTAPVQPVLSQVGDTFEMAMQLPELGDYLMLNRVIAFERDRRIAWEPTPGDARTAQYTGLPVGASQGYSWGYHLEPDGDTTIVTEIFDCTKAGPSLRSHLEDGTTMIPAIQQTLERLAAFVAAT